VNTVSRRIVMILAACVIFISLAVLAFWAYTSFQLARAKQQYGVYPTMREGMLAKIEENYQGIVDIQWGADGPNAKDGSNPHIGFITARVWADSRMDGKPVGNDIHDFDFPGSFFLLTRDGWVSMPEGAFPEVIGLGMVLFDLAGTP